MLQQAKSLQSDSPLVSNKVEPARCAIDENGMIIYANEAFVELGNIDEANPNIFSVFSFCEDLLEDGQPISSIPTGDHNVHIHGNPIINEFHFDWLTTSNNQRYLIASAVDQSLSVGLEQDLDTLISRIQNSTARIETATSHAEAETPEQDDFATFISMTQDILIISDPDGHIISANDHFMAEFGYSHESLKHMSFFDLFNDHNRAEIRNTLQSLEYEDTAPKNNIANFEAQIQTQDQRTRWIEWRQKYKNGKLYSSGRDITDIKTQTHNLQRRQRQLSEAEAIGRMGHWHWIIGKDDISWSEEIFRIFGVDENQYKPNLNTLTNLIHKRDLGRVVQVFQRAIIEEKNYDMEFRIMRPGGDVRFIMCEGRCEKDDTGEVIALYGIMQDMTERMLYEQELRHAKDASEQAYVAKSRFLANMSHELRTPLNAIIGFSEMIEAQMLGPIFNEKYLEYATSIKSSGHHLLDLISDILDMSKIEAGKHTLDLETLNLKDILDRTAQMVQGRAIEKNIKLRMSNIENSDVELIADRRALTQILLNLLSNAVKFTPEFGSVWVECTPRDRYMSLRVCDTGVGIPPNKLASVLKPFEQVSTEYTRDHEGTGLGLAITKELIELHGGTLLIDSNVSDGTTVTVRLPYGTNPEQG